VGEFLSVPELKENPLVQRVVDIFDANSSGDVDFKGNLHSKKALMFFFGDKLMLLFTI